MSTIYTVNNKVLKNSANDKWLIKKYVDPLNPFGLPDNNIRVKFKSGYTPTQGDTQTLVDSTNNIWDIYKQSNEWNDLFKNNTNILEILGANTTNVTSMTRMFAACSALSNVQLFDTSNVTNIEGMFDMYGVNSALTSIPLFNTSRVYNMNAAFYNCKSVQSGALALYQQASSQTNPPGHHINTFYDCGKNTTTGAAELAQIPYDWKNS